MINRICKWIVFKCVYPIVYCLGRIRKTADKKILFVENHGEVLSDNYTLLYKAFQEKGYCIHVHYLKVATSSWGRIFLRTISLLWDMSNARCVFLNESNSVFGAFSLRKETKLIQLWHACGAFKKWGFSVADKSFGDDKENLIRYSGHKNYSLVAVSGKNVCWAYEEAFGLQKKPAVVQAVGVSRTDVYFSEERKRQAKARLQSFVLDRKLTGKLENRKIILYAPTFRGDIKGAKSPTALDLQELSVLQEEYVVFVKQHPFVQEEFPIPEAFRDFCIEIGQDLSIEDLIMLADVCVTDYSSIVFEYSLMCKPILFFAYDLKEYYDERGFYYPYEEFVPGPVVTTTGELVEKIETIETYDMGKVEQFAKAYMSGCDGHSTERILQYALDE